MFYLSGTVNYLEKNIFRKNVLNKSFMVWRRQI